MTARLYLFRPFQTARAQAARAGISDAPAIARIRAAQHNGHDGNHIAGELRQLAHYSERAITIPTPTGAA